jgi:hypothetical protein
MTMDTTPCQSKSLEDVRRLQESLEEQIEERKSQTRGAVRTELLKKYPPKSSPNRRQPRQHWTIDPEVTNFGK